MLKKTTLILGAGASIEFGYPLGTELKSKILEILDLIIKKVRNLDDEINKYLSQYSTTCEDVMNNVISKLDLINPNDQFDEKKILSFLIKTCKISPNTILNFYEQFKGSHLNTIDAFLEGKKEFIELGRLLIAYVILSCEIEDNLSNTNNGKNWYNYLLNEIGIKLKDIESSGLKIITFNYDRSFEHYFIKSMINTHGEGKSDDPQQYIDLLNKIECYHVHGDIGGGKLTWGIGNSARIYSNKVKYNEVIEASNSIKIISEVDVQKSYEKVINILNNSNQIFILGFGFDSRNLDRLKLSTYKKPIYASRTRISDREIKEISMSLYNSVLFSKNEEYGIIDFLKKEIGLSGIRSDEHEKFKFPHEKNKVKVYAR